MKIAVQNELFKDVPEESQVWESHNDEVKLLPKEFTCLASTANCNVQAIKHNDKLIYGLQFHPEVEQTEFGHKIFENFVNICKKNKDGTN